MNIDELRTKRPDLYQAVFAAGFDCGLLNCRDNSARGRIFDRQVEAAELIAGAVESRDRAPVNFARVLVKVAGNGGPAFVVPTYGYEQRRLRSAYLHVQVAV